MAEETGANAPGRLQYGQRKASFTDTLNKLKTNTFTRRRTAPDTSASAATSSSSSSYTKIEPQEDQPQSSRLPRSKSLFNNLNPLVSRGTTSHINKDSKISHPNPVKRKITNRLNQSPSLFNSLNLNFLPPPEEATEPLLSKAKSNRQITQRALMQPLNPPLPRRSTMGNLTQKPLPGFMRPTSSSAARRNSGPAPSKSHAPTKAMTPSKPRTRPSGQFTPATPATNFSRPSMSRMPKETVQESTTPAVSPKVSFEQSERPKLAIKSNLTYDQLLRTITPDDEIEKVSAESPAIDATSDEPTGSDNIFVPNPWPVSLLASLHHCISSSSSSSSSSFH